MRYYAVLGAEDAPHVIAEFVRRNEPLEFNVVDPYSEAFPNETVKEEKARPHHSHTAGLAAMASPSWVRVTPPLISRCW